jgi:RTX calcium-binding nonapeptide repeat (4 copies)
VSVARWAGARSRVPIVQVVLGLALGLLIVTPASARSLTGGPRADRLVGTAGHDVLAGRGGNDRLDGRGGADRLSGGPGADVIVADGRDTVDGGPGDDRVTLSARGAARFTVRCGGGHDRLTLRLSGTARAATLRKRAHGCEQVVVRRAPRSTTAPPRAVAPATSVFPQASTSRLPRLPVADFTVSPLPAVRTHVTTFAATATCSVEPCTYVWLHGDASSTDELGTGPVARFTYTGPTGGRTVTLVVTDGWDREASSTQSFDLVEPSPTPSPSPTPTATPTPTASPSPTPAPTPSPSPTATPAPTPSPSPTATPAPTPSAPIADFVVSPDPAARTEATTFTSTGSCPDWPCTYLWLHGDASSTDELGSGPVASFTYTGPTGVRTVTLVVTDDSGREALRTQSFDLVEPSPTPTPSPSATPTPTPTPTATPAPTSSPTPSPTPTPTPVSTPSSSGSGCPLPAFPDATCTGVPAGTQLTAYTGPSTITTPNTVIDGRTLGCIRVRVPGVVIRNSRISCANPAPDVVSSADGDYSGTPLLVEDSEIDCQNQGGTAVGDTNITVERVNIHGCENGFDVDANVDIEDSYIHDLYNSAESHTDGIQFGAGHYDANHGLVTGTLNITILHNTILSMAAGSPTPDGNAADYTTSAIISGPRNDTNVLIQDNLLAGGAYTLYCENGSTGINYRVIGNHFSTRFKPTVGYYGPATECSDDTQSGNVYAESGKPLTLG